VKINFPCEGFGKLSYYSLHLVRSLLLSWQRWQSHHWICHTWKPHATSKHHVTISHRTGVMGDQSLHCRNKNFPPFCSCDLNLDPMTFLYKLDMYSLEIHWMCKYELLTSRLLKVIIWQTYRQTEKFCVVTSGYVTEMAVTSIDPPHSKMSCYTQTW